MSDAGAGAASGGFIQSSNAFGGFNNTDLRPRRDGRRPVPLINTSFITRRQRVRARSTRENHMRKNFAEALGTLQTSVLEIVESGAENRDELLGKSFSEFETAIGAQIDEIAPTHEPLAKGLNLIASFASALAGVQRTVEAICEGKPYAYSSMDDREDCPEHVQEALDRFIDAGETALSMMVNDHVALPEDEDDAEKAEQAGELHKLETDEGEILVKSALPAELLAKAVDPALIAAHLIEVGEAMTDQGVAALADLDAEGLLAPELYKAIPERFRDEEQGDEQPAGDEGGEDPEAGGEGEDPDAGAEGGEGGDPAGDMNPIEVIARLASAILVVAGAMVHQGGEGGDEQAVGDEVVDGAEGAEPQDEAPSQGDENQGVDAEGEQMRQANAQAQAAEGPAGGEPEDDKANKKPPVQKVEAPGELAKANQQNAVLTSQVEELQKQLGALGALVKDLASQPAPAKGALMAVPKAGDDVLGKMGGAAGQDLEQLAKTNPTAAAKLMIKAAHSHGGRPFTG